ncbi:hypothetical protein [Paenacidovorax monticola]|uniref:Uncharacterized protein n=1 Tax=Paenacidovorax monticola TaxID=1926868 RepID=A0A7H0HE96_9BURK|nr:hypothetical protein [Paenacidovorax monticola]QNP58862.1 hypothetical protein H9L24_18335 [Paenacidovorax monticola]
MKKFVMTAVAAAALSAGVAQAYTVGTFTNGVVVPNVVHNTVADTTAVGFVNQSTGTIGVFWTFFDQNSNHVTDGCFPMTSKQYKPFIWSQESGVGLEGKRGYLVFAVGANTAASSTAAACAAANATAQGSGAVLAASAFQVNTAAQDVAFVPVIDGDLTISGNLSTMGPDSLTAVTGAAPVGNTFSLRYGVDGAVNSGVDTRIAVWSLGDQRGTHTVNMYDDQQNRKSVNFELKEAELSWFDPETISGRPASFRDGFIEWNSGVVPADFPGSTALGSLPAATRGVFAYSTIIAPAFGAVQSILGAHIVP